VQKNISGYKGNTYGSTIGFDLRFNDNDILGVTYTNMGSNFKTSTTTKGKTTVNMKTSLPDRSLKIQAWLDYRFNVIPANAGIQPFFSSSL
jgi:hypothetical protein